MVDGLNFPINVPSDGFVPGFEEFTRRTAQAREEMRSLRREFGLMSRELRRSRDSFRETTRAQRDSNRETERGERGSRRRRRALSVEEEAERRLAALRRRRAVEARLEVRARQEGIATSRQRSRAFAQEERAQRAAAAAEDRLAVSRRRNQILAERGIVLGRQRARQLTVEEEANRRLARAERESAIAGNLAVRGFDTQGRALESRTEALTKRLNSFFFTFRRLIGVFAAFAAARALTRAFSGLIKGSVEFRSTLEQNELGIRAILTASSDLYDSTGRQLTAAQQLNIATAEARRQQMLLRVEGLRTAATFEQLSETFQVGLAEGLRQGLSPDFIRRFTVRISQAASSIRLEQGLLAEEIRSILAGTIQARTTRIATSLGITNEDIRRAKELGTLAEFLTERFEAFGAAGEVSLGTFAALLTNTKDAIQILLGTEAAGFFEEIKGALRDVQGSIASLQGDEYILNPQAQKGVREIFEGLEFAVQEARKLGEALSFRDLGASATIFSSALKVISVVLSSIIEGGVRGIRVMRGLFQEARNLANLGSVGSFLPSVRDARTTLVILSQIVTVLTGFRIGLALISGLFGRILKTIALVRTSSTAIGVGVRKLGTEAVKVLGIFRRISAPVRLLGLGLAAVLVVVQEILSDIFGVQVELGTVVRIVRVALSAAFRGVAAVMQLAFISAINVVSTAVRTLIQGIREGITGILEVGASTAKKLGFDVDALQKKIEGYQDATRARYKENAIEAARQIAEASEEVKKQFGIIAKQFPEGIAGALKGNEKDGGFGSALTDILNSIKSALGGDLAEESDRVAESAERLYDAFSRVPPAISAASRALSDQAGVVDQIKDSLIAARGELELSRASSGLEGADATIAKEFASVQVQSAEKLRELNSEIARIQADQGTIQARKLAIESRLALLSAGESQAAQRALEAGVAYQRLEGDRIEARDKVRGLEVQISLAQKSFNADQVASLALQAEQAREIVKQLDRQAQSQSNVSDEILRGLSPEQAERVTEITLERLNLLAREAANANDIKVVSEGRLNIEKRILEVVNLRVRSIVEQEGRALREQTREAESRVRTETDILNIRRRHVSSTIEAAREAQGQLELEQIHLELLEQRTAAQERSLRAQIAQTEDAETRLALETRLADLIKSNSAKIDEQTLTVADTRDKSIEATTLAQGSLIDGIQIGIQQLNAELPTAAETGISAIRSSVESLAEFIADAITTAFDPSTDQGLLERFAAFVRALANTVIKELIRIAIIKAILNALNEIAPGASPGPEPGAGAGGAPSAPPAGGAHGGIVKSGGGMSWAHVNAAGYSRGGFPRGIGRTHAQDPRDRVPIWARVGEALLAPEKVALYGRDRIQQLIDGTVDPAAFAAITGASSGAQAPPPNSTGAVQGLATGGFVREVRGAGSSPNQAQGTELRPVLVASNAQMKRLATEGSDGLYEAISADSDRYRRLFRD